MAAESGASFSKVIRDPIHNLVRLEGDEGRLILDLIQTPEVQRLRRIRQLGLTCLTYPMADHSRFAHSLGVYHVARRMLDALQGRRHEDPELYDALVQQRRVILAAAVLHDIGHGPFSHIYEGIVPRPTGAPADYPKNHEDWTIRVIRDRIANVCSEHGVRPDDVCNLIGKAPGGSLLARDCISSQIDADRLDYLLRDSYAAGVSYGQYDLDWLIHSLRIGQVAVKGQTDRVPRLCFRWPKAKAVVEGFIQARQSMYLQVYVHKTTRAYEAQLRHIFALAREIIRTGESLPGACPEALRKALAGEILTTEEYLSLDDFTVWAVLADWASRESNGGNDLSRRLAKKAADLVWRRHPYKVLVLGDKEKKVAATKMEGYLERDSGLARFYCYRDEYQDVPYKGVFYRGGKEEEEAEARSIHFLNEADEPVAAEAVSKVIGFLAHNEEEVCRLFYDEREPCAQDALRQYKLIGGG